MMTYLLAFVLLMNGIGVTAEFHTLDGRVIRGQPVEGAPGKSLRIEEGTGVLTALDLKALHAVYFEGAASQNPGPPAAGIRLADGSILGGAVQTGDGEVLFFSHPYLGSLKIPIDLLSTLLLDAPSLPRDFGAYQPDKVDDVVYKGGGKIRGRDFVSGTLDRFTDSGLTFESGLGSLTFTYEELEGLTLAQTEASDRLEGLGVFLVFRGGSGVVRARLDEIRRTEVRVATLFEESLVVPLKHLDSMVIDGASFTCLSDLEPIRVKETPYLGGEQLFLYPWKKDRSVTGRWLTCGGRIFARGVGAHSRCVLEYPLGGAYLAFESFLGISDEVIDLPATGAVRFFIEVDGSKVYQSPILHGGDPAVKMPRVELKGAEQLTITVDFADGFDSGDRALLGNPILIKN